MFNAANRECGAIDQEVWCKLTNNDLRQQTRARRALLDWLRRLACRNSSVLRSLRGGNERNITKSLADRFWADHAPLGESLGGHPNPANGGHLKTGQ